MDAQLILASASPRRQALLRQAGIVFRQQVTAIDESPLHNESAEDCVVRLALEKARAVRQHEGEDELPVLGADTSVVLDGRMLGKPGGPEQARQMLQALSGREHRVLSAVALVREREAVRLSTSRVWFRPLEAAEIDAYWRTGEPRDKAGGYAIQGIGALFIERLEGSYTGVMGLPLYETGQLLQEFGIQVLDNTHDS
ncbi:MAG TPA: septum formation inhibitor Maf [Gammaproteobacteria bacterium]|nr:septum formation inhibitor Maf [Gammaproteobacteria bacterium]